MQVVFSPHLTKPRPERERGSGYVNLSAQARNRARLAEASKVYLMKPDGPLIVPAWLRPQFELQCRFALERRDPVLAAMTGLIPVADVFSW